MFNSLLVPLDGSPLAEAALPYGLLLAERLGARLLLLQAQPVAAAGEEGPAPGRRGEQGAASPYLEGLQRQASARGLACKLAVVPGRPAEAILDTAASARCDLIAMSTHGRSGFTRWVLGSVADQVVHAASVPVLLIRPAEGGAGKSEPPALKKIVVPLDGSSLAEAALAVAERLARALGLSLLLVQAVDPRIYSYLGPEVGISYQNINTVLERTAGDYLALLAADAAKSGLPVESLVLHGLPGDSISDVARRTPGSLVVMSSHGRSGLSRWALGSVAEKVVRDSSAPVLVLQSKLTGTPASRQEGRAT
ncbi:MAG: universal stress protein [Chloroflexi bacterium]|nr:universal stress protein [Chloroflexota bacterium]